MSHPADNSSGEGRLPLRELGASRVNSRRTKALLHNNTLPATDNVDTARSSISATAEVMMGGRTQDPNVTADSASPAPHSEQDEVQAQKEQTGSRRGSQTSAAPNQVKKRHSMKTIVGPWELGMDLGEGMSASVRKARHLDSGELVAVKIINLYRAHKMQTQSILDIETQRQSQNPTEPTKRLLPMVLQREIAILKAIDHPNVTKLIDVWENRGDVYLFMEYVENGELLNYVIQHRYLSEVETVRMFRQLISGVQHCHRFLLCHRDIKPENILLDQHYNLKLADFGMASMHNNRLLKTSCGSPHYAAPEIVTGKPYRGDLADVWSCGVVLFVMLTGGVPFGGDWDSEHVQEIIGEVLRGRIDYTQTPASVSWPARDLVGKILERNPERRIPLSAIWYHPLFRQYENISRIPEQRKYWLGGPLKPLTNADCGPQLRNPCDLDPSVLEGLCTLWHTDDESRFVRALLSPRPSYEKILYTCLRKHRVEQEENYRGAVTVQPSPSDYHHIAPRPLLRAQTKVSLLGPGTAAKHSSQFSVVQPGSRRPSVISRRTVFSGSGSGSGSGGSGSVPETETTYDPYRSSKPQVIYRGDPYTRVDVVRLASGSSKASLAYRPWAARHGPSSSIWESTVGSSMVSMPSSPPGLPRDPAGHVRALRHTTAVRKVSSRSSMGSSVTSRGSARSLRFSKTPSYKRNISFRRFSDLPPRPDAPTPASHQQQYLQQHLREDAPQLPASPGNRNAPSGRSLPDIKPINADRDGTKTPRTPHSSMGICLTDLINDPAMQASDELSRYCDLAFSSSSSRQRSEYDDVFVDSPTPVAHPENAALAARLTMPGQRGSIGSLPPHVLNKTLPELPDNTHNPLQVQRKLMRALQKLREEEKQLEPGRLNAAMAEIERAMRLNAPGITEGNQQYRISVQDRRVRSENDRRLLESSLSPVREGRENESPGQQLPGRRYASEPLHRSLDLRLDPQEPGRQESSSAYTGPTIRMVSPSPAPESPCQGHDSTSPSGIAMDPESRVSQPRVVPRRRGSRERLNAYSAVDPEIMAFIPATEGQLDTINEHESAGHEEESKRESNGSRFKNLFRRNSSSSKSLDRSPSKRLSRLSFGSTDKLNQASASGAGASREVLPRRGSMDALTALNVSNTVDNSRVDDWQDRMHHAITRREASVAATGDSEFPSRGDGEKARTRSRSVGTGFWKSLFRREKRDPMQLVEPGDADSIFAGSSLGSQSRNTPNASVLSVGRMSCPGGGEADGGDASTTAPVGEVSNSVGGDYHQPPWPGLAHRGAAFPQSLLQQQQQPTATNWFARLLQVKPAMRTLAFDSYRTRILKEIRSVFRDWRRYGVRDIVVEKSAGRIWARVIDSGGRNKNGDGSDNANDLKIKGVEIMVEVYSVIYTNGPPRGKGRGKGKDKGKGKAPEVDDALATAAPGAGGMSVARMHQIRGAKSSFERCADQLERIFRDRGLLVTDKGRAKEMKRCLDDLRK